VSYLFTESDKGSAASAIGKAIGGRRTYSGTRKWWRTGNHNDLEWRVSLTTDDGALEVMVKPSEVGEGEAVYFNASDSFPTFESEAGDVEYESAEQFVSDVTEKAKDHIQEGKLREVIREEIRRVKRR
jgi:hypothetical protein